MEEDALFELAYEARREMRLEIGDEELDEDADASTIFLNAKCKIRTGRPIYTADASGDIHVCFGQQCKHVKMSHEKQYVCEISGRVVGIEHERESDPGWTGRSTGSANPDDTAGTPVGGWVKRRDMFQASVMAYRNAHTISDAEIVPILPPSQANPPTIKRGALCVDESPDTSVAPKRPRSSRKENWSRESIDKMANEAVGVIDKLFIVTQKPEVQAPLDPRLQNLEFVKNLAIRKFIKECSTGQSSLNMDVLSNVLIHANDFVKSQRAIATERLHADAIQVNTKRNRTNACFSGQVRNQLSQLIVSLWRASCLTTHFLSGKKGGDSFRPFAAGILYSLKRGLYLPDGTCVVPVLEELSVHLPALRSASSTAAAKQLQSSSHRGICSIQKAIASISKMREEDALPVRTLLRDASRQGAFLREMVSRNS